MINISYCAQATINFRHCAQAMINVSHAKLHANAQGLYALQHFCVHNIVRNIQLCTGSCMLLQ